MINNDHKDRSVAMSLNVWGEMSVVSCSKFPSDYR